MKSGKKTAKSSPEVTTDPHIFNSKFMKSMLRVDPSDSSFRNSTGEMDVSQSMNAYNNYASSASFLKKRALLEPEIGQNHKIS